MRLSIVIPLTLLLAANGALARTSENVSMDMGAAASISVSSCFDEVPTQGFAPIDITINNHSGSTQTWAFKFSCPGYVYGGSNQMQSTFSISVENNGTRTVPLAVPMSDETRAAYNPLEFQVSGYGVNTNNSGLGAHAPSGSNPTPFVAISNSLGTAIWSSLKSKLVSAGSDLIGSTFNPQDLPADWRALEGVAIIWMTGDEYAHLSPAQMHAVVTWVHAGGHLKLCGAAKLPDNLDFAGFGSAEIVSSRLNFNAAESVIRALPARSDGPNNITSSSSQYGTLISVNPNVGLLSAFVGLFGLIVGPFNIFFLARKRRQRILWTTPLISVGASILLIGIIAMEDGTGGNGYRNAVVCIFPQDHTAVIQQEQMSRTGLLFGSAFESRDAIWIRQLDLGQGGNLSRILSVDGDSYAKDWFASRGVQAQHIVTVLPTRSEITLVNSADVGEGAAPVIISSFDRNLDQLVYTDSAHRMWQGQNIGTGTKITLQAVTGAVRQGMPVPSEMAISFPGNGTPTFWATANNPVNYIATLPSVHWMDAPITYIGPVTEGEIR